MKKVLFVGAFLFLGAASLTSCKKDYQCKMSASAGDQTYSTTKDFDDLSKSEADDKKEDCENGGGDWSTK